MLLVPTLLHGRTIHHFLQSLVHMHGLNSLVSPVGPNIASRIGLSSQNHHRVQDHTRGTGLPKATLDLRYHESREQLVSLLHTLFYCQVGMAASGPLACHSSNETVVISSHVCGIVLYHLSFFMTRVFQVNSGLMMMHAMCQ